MRRYSAMRRAGPRFGGWLIVIHRGNEPVVRLVAISQPVAARRFGATKGRLCVPSLFDPLPESELEGWER
jgi:antitoxin (DNA-binding transcriptional repressor) of toxin-antitoxin stability system